MNNPRWLVDWQPRRCGDRAWWFYFVSGRRIHIDVVELNAMGGEFVAGDPAQPTFIDIKTEPVQKLEQKKHKRKHRKLDIDNKVIENEGHANNKPEAFNRGLHYLLQDK